MTRSDKPKIEKSRGIWHCRNYLFLAEGDSPIDAYRRLVEMMKNHEFYKRYCLI